MPQRWERELQRVERLRAPDSTRARIEGGPRGDGMPPSPGRGQRLLAGVVALAVFAGALVFTVNAFGHRPSVPIGSPSAEQVVFAFTVQGGQAGGSHPRGTMSLGDRTVDGNGSTYSWTEGNSQGIFDTFGTEFQFDQWYGVPAGAPIGVQGSADSVTGWVDSCCDGSAPPPHLWELQLTQQPQIPVDAGRYVLEFTASWAQGDRTFYFPVRVVPPEEAPPSVSPQPDEVSLMASVTSPDDGSVPELTLSSGRLTEQYPGAGRWSGEQVAIVSMLFIFGHRLEAGASLRIESDADRVEVRVAAARSEGGWSDPVVVGISDGVSHLPDDPGGYLLGIEAWWPEGHIGYSVAITVGRVPEPSVSPLPDVREGIVPDVVGLGSGDAEKLLDLAGFEPKIAYMPTANVAAGTVVATDPTAGTSGEKGMVVTLTVSGTDVPLDGYLTQLACSDANMMPFVSHAAAFGDPETTIRKSIEGILPTDRISQFRFDQGVQPMGLWEVERAGDVLAVVQLPSLEGIACRGSGIGGV